MRKTLTLLRHAKTEAGAATQDDCDRALVPRGIEAARAMGQYLVAQGISPDVVLCSTAVRARQTASYLTSLSSPSPLAGEGGVGGSRNITNTEVVAGTPHPNPPPQGGRGLIEYTDKMYLPSAAEMLNILAEMPESARHVMLIGHNPGMHELAVRLAKSGDEALLDALAINYPTCTLSTIVFDGDWQDIAHAEGELTGFLTPKQLG